MNQPLTKIELPDPFLSRVTELAERESVQAYLVGGYVRDILLNRRLKDIDISIVGDGIAFAHALSAFVGGSTVVTFEKFGTARFLYQEVEIEIVGTRKEVYRSDSRKPEVTVGTIQDDLRRRDFTVNALAVSLNGLSFGELMDPFGGMADLKKKLLRTPDEPARTFAEDPLRMMRAFRFVAQLEFALAPECLEAICSMPARLGIISMERIRDEFLRILQTSKPSLGLIPLLETGLLQQFFPELHQLAGVDQRSIDYPGGPRSFHHKDVFHHTMQVLDSLCEESDDLWLRLAALLHDIAKPKTKAFRQEVGWTFHGHAEIGARMVKKIFHRLKLPMERLRFVEKLVALHLRPIALVSEGVTDSAIRRLLFDAQDDIDDLLLLCRADITSKNPKLVRRYMRNYELLKTRLVEVEEHDRLRNWQAPLSGHEIMDVCGISEGIVVGILKTRIEDAILDGVIENTREAALEFLQRIKNEVLQQPGARKKQPRRTQLSRLPENLRT